MYRGYKVASIQCTERYKVDTVYKGIQGRQRTDELRDRWWTAHYILRDIG